MLYFAFCLDALSPWTSLTVKIQIIQIASSIKIFDPVLNLEQRLRPAQLSSRCPGQRAQHCLLSIVSNNLWHDMDWSVKMPRMDMNGHEFQIVKSQVQKMPFWKMRQLSWECLPASNILPMLRPRDVLWNFLSMQMFNAYTSVTAVELAPFQM